MAIIRYDKVSAETHLYSMVLKEDVANGSAVKLGKYADFDTYEAEKPNDLAKDTVVFIGQEFLPYDELNESENMILKKGKRVRAFDFVKSDIITVTNDGITGTPKVGEYVIAKKGDYKLTASATKDGSLVFEVVALETYRNVEATVLRRL